MSSNPPCEKKVIIFHQNRENYPTKILSNYNSVSAEGLQSVSLAVYPRVKPLRSVT